jgi:hypothetical protein
MNIQIAVRDTDEAVRVYIEQTPWRELLGDSAELRVALDPAWDGATDAFCYACESGSREALPGPNIYVQGAVWHLCRSLEIFRTFEAADLHGAKLVKVWRIGGNLGVYVRALETVFTTSVPWRQQLDVIEIEGGAHSTPSVPWRQQLDVIEIEGGAHSTSLVAWTCEYGVELESVG